MSCCPKQIFYAIDKGIEGNNFKIRILEGNYTCYTTIRTATHTEEKPFFLIDDPPENEESDDAKHMTI